MIIETGLLLGRARLHQFKSVSIGVTLLVLI
jgi:hypothetical protein